MRSRVPLALAVIILVCIVPSVAHATTIPFWGPLVPDIVAKCAAGWGGVIQLVNNVIALLVTFVVFIIAPFMIAWGGFLFVISATNPGNRARGRAILIHTAVGILIALSAWLIVNFLLTVVVAPDKGVAYWTSVMFSNGATACRFSESEIYSNFTQAEGQTIVTDPQLFTNACASHGGVKENASSTESLGSNQVVCNDNSVQTVAAGTSGTVNLTPTGSGACDAGAVQQYASAGGYAISNSQAQTLACIAQPESNCGAKVTNYAWGKGSSAAGAWQILLQSNAQYFENQTCYQAAGVSGNLNCAAGFSGGNPKSDAASQTIVNNCLKAAANVECSAVAASALLKANGGSFSAWTADPHGAQAQKTCISKYAGT